jgi:hypothetical protein
MDFRRINWEDQNQRFAEKTDWILDSIQDDFVSLSFYHHEHELSGVDINNASNRILRDFQEYYYNYLLIEFFKRPEEVKTISNYILRTLESYIGYFEDEFKDLKELETEVKEFRSQVLIPIKLLKNICPEFNSKYDKELNSITTENKKLKGDYWSLQERFDLLYDLGFVKQIQTHGNAPQSVRDEVLSKILGCDKTNARKLQNDSYGKGNRNKEKIIDLIRQLKNE